MRLLHRHRWHVVRRRFHPPARNGGQIEGRGPSAFALAERLFHGFTTIEQQCEECGLRRIDERLGDLT